MAYFTTEKAHFLHHLLRAAAGAIAFAVAGAGAAPAKEISHMKQPDVQAVAWPPIPAVAGHRGAPAFLPEHTLASYQRAIDDGADLIEPDLVATRDGVLVARHENEISGTTNIAGKPAFANRRTTKIIDGVSVTGWFTEDFTLAELKTLKAIERIPLNRPANLAYDNLFDIPTLQEIIDLAQHQSQTLERVIGIYPETKHPSYFQSIGLALEKRLIDQLQANGYKDANAPVLIQSFEVANLKALRGMTTMRLVQLIDTPRNRPYDFTVAGDTRTYADLITPAGLREIATYADIVAPYKEVVIPRDARNELGNPTAFVGDAHAAGLQVHVFTMRQENPFLPVSLRKRDMTSPSMRGDSQAEIKAYLEAGIDGFFTDDSAVGRAAVGAFLKSRY